MLQNPNFCNLNLYIK